jgi:hypothetical protein
LIKVTKPGKPVIIVYSNPNAIVSSLKSLSPFRVLRRISIFLKRRTKETTKEESVSLYFYAHPIEWWNRFNDIACIKILPWRSFSSYAQKLLIPNNKVGSKIFGLLFNLEERFPVFFVKHFSYPMIILTKREG